MKTFVLWCSSIAVAIALVIAVVPKATTTFAAAGDITGAAWSSNIGWINMKGSNYAVKIDTTGTTRNLSGYGWSSNIGWVSFNGAENSGCPTGTCQARVEWGTSGGPSVLVKGWARACSVFAAGCSGALKPQSDLGGWDGFISLGDSKPTDGVNFGVKLNTTTGNATGYAWGSEVVGWVDFSGVKFDVTGDPTICSDGITRVPPASSCPTTCPNGTPIPPSGGCVPPPDCTDGSCPDCPPGSDCYCNANPTDVQYCPTNCPSNPAVGTACWCTIPANQGAVQCQNVGGICTNIPDNIEQGLISQGLLTNPVTPPYRKTADGKCLCVAGYILDPVSFQCKKPVYTEH